MIKKIISITVLTAMLILINITVVSADNKDQEADFDYKVETVYGNLEPTGEVKALYIVNEFDVTKQGLLSDFGVYSSVKNLTNVEKISNEDSKISAYSDEGKFYYQGDLESKKLPWNFDIKYTVDGKTVEPDNLAGDSGNLEISIKTEKNDNISEEYYEKYMLQITVTLDSENTDDLIINNGTLNSVGGYKLVTFTSMPNQDLECSLKAYVNDFEMTGISINAVPLSFGLDMLDMDEFESGLTDLATGVAKLNQGANKLKIGSLGINSGISYLADGSGEFYEGLLTLNNSGEGIGDGSKQIKASLDTLNQQLQGMSNDELIAGLTGIKDGLTDLSAGLEGIRLTMMPKTTIAIELIPESTLTTSEIDALVGATDVANQDTLNLLLDYYEAGVDVKTEYAQEFPVLNASLTNIKYGIDNTVLGIDQIIVGADDSGLEDLVAGVNQLALGYGEFDAGLSEYLGGIGTTASGYSELNTGLSDLNDQYKKFDNGIIDLSDGISELNNSTKKLPDEIDEMMAEYDNTNYKPLSYASKDNEEIESLQFLLITDSIEIEQEQTVTDSEEEDLNFLQRFIRLFIGD